jgi:WD40 repeat protein
MGRRLKAWNLSDGQLMYSLDQSQIGFGDMTISPDGKTLVVAEGFGNNINVWDLKSQKKISTLYGHSGAVTSVVFRSNNELVSASMDGTIKLWKLH